MTQTNNDSAIMFKATIPPIKSAFQADGDVVRVTFEIPKQYRNQGLRLAGMFDRVLNIGVEEE